LGDQNRPNISGKTYVPARSLVRPSLPPSRPTNYHTRPTRQTVVFPFRRTCRARSVSAARIPGLTGRSPTARGTYLSPPTSTPPPGRRLCRCRSQRTPLGPVPSSRPRRPPAGIPGRRVRRVFFPSLPPVPVAPCARRRRGRADFLPRQLRRPLSVPAAGTGFGFCFAFCFDCGCGCRRGCGFVRSFGSGLLPGAVAFFLDERPPPPQGPVVVILAPVPPPAYSYHPAADAVAFAAGSHCFRAHGGVGGQENDDGRGGRTRKARRTTTTKKKTTKRRRTKRKMKTMKTEVSTRTTRARQAGVTAPVSRRLYPLRFRSSPGPRRATSALRWRRGRRRYRCRLQARRQPAPRS